METTLKFVHQRKETGFSSVELYSLLVLGVLRQQVVLQLVGESTNGLDKL